MQFRSFFCLDTEQEATLGFGTYGFKTMAKTSAETLGEGSTLVTKKNLRVSIIRESIGIYYIQWSLEIF